MRQISIGSPAKINLWLQVTGKMPDNYHSLCTIFQMIDLCDRITLTERDEGITIKSNGNIPADNRNLAHKAASLIFNKYGLSGGVEIEIDKHIPVAAGLGGGSSNAASTIIGLKQLFSLDIPPEEMLELGREIGSDVPFFLSGYTSALGKGRGEILAKIDIEDDFYILLVNPRIEVSTAWAYANLSLTKAVNAYRIDKFMSKVSLKQIVPGLRNDLETAVIGRHPIIGEIKERLVELGAMGAAMSGSGSTLFGIFQDSNSVASACSSWNIPDCDLFVARPVRSILDIYPRI
ncbi:MAG: 4-(cytidine 5'-diphospho)-2-C-methyl-D-erythritol kinase [Nitrospinota bacterium]